ncbi:peptide-methionine (S)-S-oxide reductase [Gramella jeungdoensis]|uniref:peptide-methionine (S)-S-oxide reductase n=1 Tax=Gramella jeungdoensis TaxID=708091 RepID=A0ABT0Z307_9FLAO|nr:peptide-methionine (S)-S-oxide reductase [Gramella jeungdoensis]MCM8570110.1 peptide-methionine (S)-S-oxide reductase [Gramella jeungdoensis]
MLEELPKIGFGGGCHWCTEAVFQSIKGVGEVKQGYISTEKEKETFFEGVLVYFDPGSISLQKLIEIHLQTHQSTSNHSMRSKYLSAVYTFDPVQYAKVLDILASSQGKFEEQIITTAHMFGNFKASRPEIRNYYKTDPERPFCKLYIEPKLKILEDKFQSFVR